MKKSAVLLAALAIALTVGACKPKQSHYRQVYEQAKQRDIAQTDQSTTAPETSESDVVVSKPAEAVVTIRKERLNPLEGEETGRLKLYSVVIGSFQNSTNAYSLKERMEGEGFTPILAENEMGMLRVIVTSFESRDEAIQSREAIKERFAPLFQDAWLLERDK